jgi:hypothetical protein
MAYYGRDPITMKKKNQLWNSLLQKERQRLHKKKIRAGPATDVYRAPKPLGGQPGRAFKPGELEETMKDWQHFYNKKNLATDPLSLGKSAPEALKEKQAKLDTRPKNLRKSKFPVTYSLKSDPVLLENRKKQEAPDAKANPTTNMRDYKTTLKFKKENYFGGKTKKRRRKKKRKTRRRKKKTKRKRKYRKKRTRRKRGGNKQLSDKQTFLKEVKKNEKKLKPMFTDFMDRFIISKKTITFNMVLKEIENMKDSEFEKNINNIINNKSRSKKGGVLLPDPAHHLIGDDNVDTYNCVLFVIIVTVAISQIWFSSQWLRGERGVRFGLGPALEIMDDIMGPVLTFLNIFCRVWVLFHNHPPQLSTHLRRQDSARDIMQQINRVEPMIIRQRVLAGAPDSFDTVFSWQAMENYLHEIRQIVEQFENRYYAPADSTAGTKRGI